MEPTELLVGASYYVINHQSREYCPHDDCNHLLFTSNKVRKALSDGTLRMLKGELSDAMIEELERTTGVEEEFRKVELESGITQGNSVYKCGNCGGEIEFDTTTFSVRKK